MEFLQNVDTGTLLLLAIGCVLLCVFGLLIVFGLQLIGTTLSTFLGIFEFFGGIIGGGPAAWCGCLVFLFICGGIAAIVWVVTSCNANPYSMNFCQLF